MKDLCDIKKVDITVNNRPRMYCDNPEGLYPSGYNYASMSRWLARWYKCFCYEPKKK